MIWNTETLTQWVIQLYDGLLRHEHIVSNEMVKKVNDIEVYGYILEKDNLKTGLKDRYFVKSDHVELLPFKVMKSAKFDYRSEVFQLVLTPETKRIPNRQDMTLPEMRKFFANYKHSEPTYWNLARMLILIAYFERINQRIVSEAAFGKDGLVDILSLLNGNVAKVEYATLGKLKQVIPHHDLIVCNEVGGLNKTEKYDMQKYLLPVGAYGPFYENNSCSIGKSKDKVMLRNKSHVIFHNIPSYYKEHGQPYFDELFQTAVIDRFPGLLFKGYVTENFSKAMHVTEITQEQDKALKSFISSLNYYKSNKVSKHKYTVNDDFWNFKGKEKQRSLRSFTIISKWLSHMTESEQEFVTYCKLLNQCRIDYKEMVKDLEQKEKNALDVFGRK